MSDETKPATKPGYRTTEFYLAMAAVLLSLLFASGLLKEGGQADKIAGFVAAALTAAGYSVSRSMVKTKA